MPYTLHTENSFQNLVISNWTQIVFTIFRLIWNQTDIRLVPNQSENGKYNLISGWINKISKRFLCVGTKRRSVAQLSERRASPGTTQAQMRDPLKPLRAMTSRGLRGVDYIPVWMHAHREFFFKISLNETEIRLYLPFSDWFVSKQTSTWIQINWKW